MSESSPGHSGASYPVPDLQPGQSLEHETEVKRSRFIACVIRVFSRSEAIAWQNSLKARFPDASHHCLAFVAGPPEGNTSVGFDDDGEPGGTAGKPMLNVLQHKKIGEIAVVVVRYFGGTKLGAGGLVRAYGASVQAACDVLPVSMRIASVAGRVIVDYAFEQPVRHLLEGCEGVVESCQYTDKVEMLVNLPESNAQSFSARLTEVCKGQVEIHWQD